MPKRLVKTANGKLPIPGEKASVKKKAPTRKKSRRSLIKEKTATSAPDHLDDYIEEVAVHQKKGNLSRQTSASVHARESRAVREIGELDFQSIDFERRNSCRYDLEKFFKTYIPDTFKDGEGIFYDWSLDQLDLISLAEKIILQGGKHARAMPRGGGKTSICKGALLWGSLYGHIHYAVYVGSTESNAENVLEFIRNQVLMNQLLLQDFPETVYPLYQIQGSSLKSRNQLYMGERTNTSWIAGEIRYPSIPLTKEQAALYPEDEIYQLKTTPIESYDFAHQSSGFFLNVFGFTGSIRGQVLTHPLTLRELRPDLAIIDDVQKDEMAVNPNSVLKNIKKVEGTIGGLAGPTTLMATFMPCTVTAPKDLSDTFLDPEKKPEWNGRRNKMVLSWPAGITDHDITDETPAGKLWTEYADLLRRSMKLYGDLHLATELYTKNREVMDDNFQVSWAARYNQSEKYKGNRELSAQQHAMNIRLTKPEEFAAEYQNTPIDQTATGTTLITAQQMATKTINLGKRETPLGTNAIAAYIDVQDEILFYSIVSGEPNLTSFVTEYGTFPHVDYHYFTKAQIGAWCLLSRAYFKAFPDSPRETSRNNRPKARLDDKIYWGVTHLIKTLLAKEFVRQDGTIQNITHIGVDTRWGEANDAVKRACRNFGDSRIIPCSGQGVKATNKQFEEYGRTTGWLFEDQVNPYCQEVKWIFKPDQSGMMHLLIDTNRAKSFLFRRLASTPGAKGSLSVYNGKADEHSLFCHHVCDSEVPVEVAAKGRLKEEWEVVERTDNDWFDCLTNSVILLTYAGCRLEQPDLVKAKPKGAPRRLSNYVKEKTPEQSTPKLSDIIKAKRGKR